MKKKAAALFLILGLFTFSPRDAWAQQCDGWAADGSTHRNAGNGCTYRCSGGSWQGPISCDGNGNGQFQGEAGKTKEERDAQAREVAKRNKEAEQKVKEQGAAKTAEEAARTKSQREREATRQQAMVETQRQVEVADAIARGGSPQEIEEINARALKASKQVIKAQGTNRGAELVGSDDTNAAQIAKVGYDPDSPLATGILPGGQGTGGALSVSKNVLVCAPDNQNSCVNMSSKKTLKDIIKLCKQGGAVKKVLAPNGGCEKITDVLVRDGGTGFNKTVDLVSRTSESLFDAVTQAVQQAQDTADRIAQERSTQGQAEKLATEIRALENVNCFDAGCRIELGNKRGELNTLAISNQGAREVQDNLLEEINNINRARQDVDELAEEIFELRMQEKLQGANEEAQARRELAEDKLAQGKENGSEAIKSFIKQVEVENEVRTQLVDKKIRKITDEAEILTTELEQVGRQINNNTSDFNAFRRAEELQAKLSGLEQEAQNLGGVAGKTALKEVREERAVAVAEIKKDAKERDLAAASPTPSPTTSSVSEQISNGINRFLSALPQNITKIQPKPTSTPPPQAVVFNRLFQQPPIDDSAVKDFIEGDQTIFCANPDVPSTCRQFNVQETPFDIAYQILLENPELLDIGNYPFDLRDSEGNLIEPQDLIRAFEDGRIDEQTLSELADFTVNGLNETEITSLVAEFTVPNDLAAAQALTVVNQGIVSPLDASAIERQVQDCINQYGSFAACQRVKLLQGAVITTIPFVAPAAITGALVAPSIPTGFLGQVIEAALVASGGQQAVQEEFVFRQITGFNDVLLNAFRAARVLPGISRVFTTADNSFSSIVRTARGALGSTDNLASQVDDALPLQSLPCLSYGQNSIPTDFTGTAVAGVSDSRVEGEVLGDCSDSLIQLFGRNYLQQFPETGNSTIASVIINSIPPGSTQREVEQLVFQEVAQRLPVDINLVGGAYSLADSYNNLDELVNAIERGVCSGVVCRNRAPVIRDILNAYFDEPVYEILTTPTHAAVFNNQTGQIVDISLGPVSFQRFQEVYSRGASGIGDFAFIGPDVTNYGGRRGVTLSSLAESDPVEYLRRVELLLGSE